MQVCGLAETEEQITGNIPQSLALGNDMGNAPQSAIICETGCLYHIDERRENEFITLRRKLFYLWENSHVNLSPQHYGVFTLPDTEIDKDTDKKWVV